MTEGDGPPPPMLDYRPPDAVRSPWPRFVGGVFTGGAMAYGGFVVGILVLIGPFHGIHGSPPRWANAIPFVVPAVVMGVGGLLAWLSPRRRPFGLGLLASVPLTALATATVCGIIR